MSHMTTSSSRSAAAEAERLNRVAKAVELVSRGDHAGGRVSVRKAALKYGLPKSTVHRYVKASRASHSAAATRTKKRSGVAPPEKCGIGFLLCD